MPKAKRQKQPPRDAWHPLLIKLIQLAVSDPAATRRLVAAHPEVLDLRTNCGETALHYLAVENYADAVRLLISLGAAPNPRNNFGSTALAEATQVGAIAAARVISQPPPRRVPARRRRRGHSK